MKRRDLILATALSSLVPTTGFTAAAGAGSVVGIVGQCLVQRDGRPTPLKLGDAVAVSDTIDVPAAGKLKLRMSDGSVISLAPGTRMTVAAYQTRSRRAAPKCAAVAVSRADPRRRRSGRPPDDL